MKCAYCKAEITIQAKFCPECGRPINVVKKDPPRESSSGSSKQNMNYATLANNRPSPEAFKKTFIYLMVAVITTFVLIIGLFYWNYSG